MSAPLIQNLGSPLPKLCIDWREHKRQAFNSEPLCLPPSIEERLIAADAIDSLADDLCTLFSLMTANIHNGGYTYSVHTIWLGDHTDLSCGSARLDVFYRTNGYHAGDPFYTSDSFVVADLYEVYSLQDNDTVAECGILDCTIGYWLTPLRDDIDASLLDSLNDKLSAGYSHYPYGELETVLMGEVVWVDSARQYRCRVTGVPYLCVLTPEPPHYGG